MINYEAKKFYNIGRRPVNPLITAVIVIGLFVMVQVPKSITHQEPISECLSLASLSSLV
jgi:hypothetical protein